MVDVTPVLLKLWRNRLGERLPHDYDLSKKRSPAGAGDLEWNEHMITTSYFLVFNLLFFLKRCLLCRCFFLA